MITLFKNRNMNLFLVATLGITLVAAIAVLLSATVPINLIDNQQSLPEDKGKNLIRPISADVFPQYHQSEWSSGMTEAGSSSPDLYHQSERTLVDSHAGLAIYQLSERTLTDPKAGMDTYLDSERTSSPVRTVSEPRLWSGEVFLSENNNPDSELNIQHGTIQDSQNVCMSEDSLPRRYSGCVE